VHSQGQNQCGGRGLKAPLPENSIERRGEEGEEEERKRRRNGGLKGEER